MKRKYEITDIRMHNAPKVRRIRALRDIPSIGVKAGDLGGYIEYKRNLSQAGDCWIGEDAKVYNNGVVSGNAHVFGDARVIGDAHVFGDARVMGDAWITGYAQVSDHVRVLEHAQIYGRVSLTQNMKISGWSYISSLSQIYYADGVTIFFDTKGQVIINGNRTALDTNIELHKMLALLKLS